MNVTSAPQRKWFDFILQDKHQVQPYEASVVSLSVLCVIQLIISRLVYRAPSTLGCQEGSSATLPSMLPDSYPTVCKLPVELLQMVFDYCTESQESGLELCRVYPHWIAITHVCRHWRAAALNHHSLWTAINTDDLGTVWAKAFMERSDPAPVDVTVRIDPIFFGTKHTNVDEIIDMLSGCTRLRTLHIIGETKTVSVVLNTLNTTTPIRSLSLNLVDRGSISLPVHLFGGQASIHEVSFVAVNYIVAPHGLFSGVTYFTSSQHIPLQDLLDTLREMPALQSFTLQRCNVAWQDTDVPCNVQIPMRNLTHLTIDVDSQSPFYFTLLHQRLALPNGAKRRLRLHTAADWSHWGLWAPSILAIIRGADRLRHIRLSGGIREGSFCLWTGDLGIEEAEFSFEVSWWFQGFGSVPSPIFDLATLCHILDAGSARKLALLINPLGCIELGRLYWWTLLESMTGVEELEVRPDALRELRYAWEVHDAPAVLPKLRRVDITQATSKTGSVEEMSEEGLMRLLRGSDKRHAD